MNKETLNGNPQLRDGCEWLDHEDCIVGNEAGLRKLISACETAIREGEYYGNDLGDYVGIKKKENEWFIDPKDSKTTRFANEILAGVLFAIFIFIVIGIYTTFNWIF